MARHKTARDPSTVALPPSGAVLEELERLLASPAFQASERRRTFLRFIVEETLAGRADRLKGYTVALEVFGRDESFDAQTDPVVRLEARRLRRDLDSYYVDAGSGDPVRISVPKGAYMPQFEWQAGAPVSTSPAEGDLPEVGAETVAEPAPPRARAAHFRRPLLAALALLTVAAALAMLAFGLHGRSAPSEPAGVTVPAVVVMPFDHIGSGEDGGFLAAGLGQELIVDLMRFPGFRLFILPPGSDTEARAEPLATARRLGVAYVVAGSVRTEGGRARVVVRLLDAETGRVRWSDSYDRPLTAEGLMGVEGSLAEEIAAALGQPYGAVQEDLRLRATAPELSSMHSYLCVLRAYGYRRTFQRDLFAPTLGCLTEAVRRDPDYSDAWAMLGWLYLDAGRFEYGSGDLQSHYAKALEAAERAVALAPNDSLALKALSSINYYMGRYDEAERIARRALELNPNDPDTLAQLGWRLAARGNFDEGVSLLERAIARTASPPPWYFHLITIDLFLKGDYQAMRDLAERSLVDGMGIGYAFLAISSAKLGNGPAAKAALERMEEFTPLAEDPAAYFRRNGLIDAITGKVVKALDEARQIASRS